MTTDPSSVPPPIPALQTPPIQTKQEKTLYNTGLGSIFWRNFIAGFARALGGVVLYAIFLGIIGQIFFLHIWPKFEPIFATFETFSQLDTTTSQPPPGGVQIDQNTLNTILNTLQKP